MNTRVSSLRKRYKPDRIKVLFVAESPPESSDDKVRFFYNPSQERHDYMYRSVMKAFFPDFEHRSGEKEKWLRRFQKAGCYMIDATDKPVNRLSSAQRRKELNRNLDRKIAEITKLTSPRTAIVLVKRNIFEIFNQPLRDARRNVIHGSFLPFPSHGHQARFIEACSKCLRAVRRGK